MSEVDKAQASNRARELADEQVQRCFHDDEQESAAALLHWARTFKRQFWEITQPGPYKARPDPG